MNFIFTYRQEKLVNFLLEKNEIFPFYSYPPRLDDLALEWSYYSAKIEGNSYSFIEAEILLKDKLTSVHRYEDAVMLKNLYKVFFLLAKKVSKDDKRQEINQEFIFKTHSLLMRELISDDYRGVFRKYPVRITGTNYKPIDDPIEIQQRFSEILYNQELIKNPFERAIYLHCNMAKLQPFIDGNKRISRLLESIVLMNENIVPVFSTEEADINIYRKALLSFYEKGDYELYADYILEQKLKYLQYFTKEDLKKEFEKSLKNGRKL